MTEALIAFGANLSNPKQTFVNAEADLLSDGVRILAKSGLWSSPAWPAGSDQPDYTNAVMSVAFNGSPEGLLQILQSIETRHGRVRTVRNAARTLDLDLLIFGKAVRKSETLTLPHPRMLDRAFVLLPLCEIDPSWMAELAKIPARDIAAMSYRGRW